VRTTLTIDDALLRDLRRAAREAGMTLKEVVNRALRRGLTELTRPPERRPFSVRTFSMGAPRANLDRALALAGVLEDDEIVRKTALRK